MSAPSSDVHKSRALHGHLISAIQSDSVPSALSAAKALGGWEGMGALRMACAGGDFMLAKNLLLASPSPFDLQRRRGLGARTDWKSLALPPDRSSLVDKAILLGEELGPETAEPKRPFRV